MRPNLPRSPLGPHRLQRVRADELLQHQNAGRIKRGATPGHEVRLCDRVGRLVDDIFDGHWHSLDGDRRCADYAAISAGFERRVLPAAVPAIRRKQARSGAPHRAFPPVRTGAVCARGNTHNPGGRFGNRARENAPPPVGPRTARQSGARRRRATQRPNQQEKRL